MEGSLPLKPVDVQDRYGFRAAIYAVNALYKRCGISSVTESYARERVSTLIKQSNPKKFSLLLEEWYSDQTDQFELQKLLRTLPEEILQNNYSRYGRNNSINDIEWSSIATIFRCCIAVKFISSGGKSHQAENNDCHKEVGWRIAVPSPQIFGFSAQSSTGPATACVFLVCQETDSFKFFFPLIPYHQRVFEPGRTLNFKKEASNGRQEKGTSYCRRGGDEMTIALVDEYKESPKTVTSDEGTEKEGKKVVFSDEKRVIGIATPVTGPSSPIIQPRCTISEDELPSGTMQIALGSLVNVECRDNSNSNSETYKQDTAAKENKVIGERRRRQEISQLSDASILFDRIYGSKSRKEREASSLEIYGRVYENRER